MVSSLGLELLGPSHSLAFPGGYSFRAAECVLGAVATDTGPLGLAHALSLAYWQGACHAGRSLVCVFGPWVSGEVVGSMAVGAHGNGG